MSQEDNVRFFNQASSVTPDLILAQTAALKPKRLVCLFIDENDHVQTLTSVMTGEQLAWLKLVFDENMHSMTRPQR